jgi:hypothetical protein
MFKGDVPEDLVIDHKCRTPSCVNPDHLEPVTQGENLRRAFVWGKYNGWKECRACQRDRDAPRVKARSDAAKAARAVRTMAVSILGNVPNAKLL